MQDVLVSFRRYKFLGPEFLTWLWYITENEPEKIATAAQGNASMVVGGRITLEKTRREETERVTIKGDTARMDEGILALKKGALVTAVSLILEMDDMRWTFNLRGEDLAISGLKVPVSSNTESLEEIEGAVLEKMSFLEIPVKILDAIFREFVRVRSVRAWGEEVVPNIREWIRREAEQSGK